MKYLLSLIVSALALTAISAQAAQPRDEDELSFMPKGTKFVVLRDIPVPTGVRKVFFQAGLVTNDPMKIDGNLKYCYMLLRNPSTKDRILEKDVEVVTSGSYRAATSVIELEIALPAGIYDLGCISAPKDNDLKATIGQFKAEIRGVFEVVMPGPDPIR